MDLKSAIGEYAEAQRKLATARAAVVEAEQAQQAAEDTVLALNPQPGDYYQRIWNGNMFADCCIRIQARTIQIIPLKEL